MVFSNFKWFYDSTNAIRKTAHTQGYAIALGGTATRTPGEQGGLGYTGGQCQEILGRDG